MMDALKFKQNLHNLLTSCKCPAEVEEKATSYCLGLIDGYSVANKMAQTETKKTANEIDELFG